MKRAAILVFAGTSLFFFSFASYIFDRQEEIQLFFPEWVVIGPQLAQAGTLYNTLGMYRTQFFCYPNANAHAISRVNVLTNEI